MTEYSYSLHQRRHDLLANLVQKILRIQPDDENHGLAMDFCLQKAYYHTFQDVIPRHTEAFYAELCALLEADSQLTKAATLSALVSKLLAVQLPTSTEVPEINHNLLQLLANLSNQPLSSNLVLSHEVLELVYQPASTVGVHQHQAADKSCQQGAHAQCSSPPRLGWRKAGKAAALRPRSSTTSSDEEVDPFQDTSSLSDWECSDGAQEPQDVRESARHSSACTDYDVQQATSMVTAPSTLQAERLLMAKHAASRSFRSDQRRLPTGRIVAGINQPISKLAAVSQAAASAASPQQCPSWQQQRRLCFSEQFLTEQVLRVLQGLPAECFIISTSQHVTGFDRLQASTFQTSAGSCATSGSVPPISQDTFHVQPDVCTPYMLPGTLQALLGEAAAAGTAARQLRTLTQQLAFSSSVGNGVPVTPCLRAFGAALQQQLDLMGLQLVELQQQLVRQGESATDHCSSPRPPQQSQFRGVLAVFLKQHARPVICRLHAVHALVSNILQQLSGPPAAVSTKLIDGLAAAVQAASGCPGQHGAAQAAAFLHLLLSSCVPLTRALAQWLWGASDSGKQQLQVPSCATSVGCSVDTWQQQQPSQLQQGVHGVCMDDFFIVRHAGKEVPAVDPSFWHSAYGFIQQQVLAVTTDLVGDADAANGVRDGVSLPTASSVCCPAVLAPFATSIMTAGKSMRLLAYMAQEELKHSDLCMTSNVLHRLQVKRSDAAAAAGLGLRPTTQQQQQLAGASAASALRRHPSTPRKRRPSSSGGRLGSSSTTSAMCAAGRLSRQPSWTGKPYSRAAAAAVAHLAEGQHGVRSKWVDDAAQSLSSAAKGGNPIGVRLPAARSTAALAQITGRARLQLAAAASVAGRQAHDELPSEFISTACSLIQHELQLQQQAMWQHQQCLLHLSGNASSAVASAGDVVRQRLQAVDKTLSRPCGLGRGSPAADSGAAVRSAALSNMPIAAPATGLREAVAAAKKAYCAGIAHLDGTSCLDMKGPQPHQTQQVKSAGDCPAEVEVPASSILLQPGSVATGVAAVVKHSSKDLRASDGPPPADGGAAVGTQCSTAAAPDNAGAAASDPSLPGSSPVTLDVPLGPGDDLTAICAAAAADATSSPDLPPLTAWRDQLEARLAATQQQLLDMAPWQSQSAVQHERLQLVTSHHSADVDASQDQQQPRGRKGTLQPAMNSSWLLRAAGVQGPGSLSGGMAELWPLKPIVGLSQALAAGSSSSSSSPGSWLQGASWPGCDLSWLLTEAPGQLPCVQQLLWTALVSPVMNQVELVDRQLMSSLMGEWGMLQQLQGLVNVFTITSPSMVEWVDILFAAVDTAKPWASSRAGASTPIKSIARAVSAADLSPPRGFNSPGTGGAPSRVAGGLCVGVEDLELSSLEAALQDCVVAAGADEVLPDPEALVLTHNDEAVQVLRHSKAVGEQAAAEDTQQQHRGAEASRMGTATGAEASAGGSGAGGVASKYDAGWTGGLLLCSREWSGLDLKHMGSWQLSLAYTHDQLQLFSKVWRLMLQMRWVRHCVGAQAVAHRSSATVNTLAARDQQEAAHVQEAITPGGISSSRSKQLNVAAAAGAAAPAEMLSWLTGKQELLLLQEMWQFMGCWQSFVLDSIKGQAWGELEQALLTAKSLDQVHKATGDFLTRVCNLCNIRPPGARGAPHVSASLAMHQPLENLMDIALAAAAAAKSMQVARQKLQQLQTLSRPLSDMKAWWLELAQARSTLKHVWRRWHSELHNLLRMWTKFKQNNKSHGLDELQEVLDMNGYFSTQVERSQHQQQALAGAMMQ